MFMRSVLRCYVGKVSRKVREHLWGVLEVYRRNGLAIMVFSDSSIESKIKVRQLGGEWEMKDVNGIKVPFRPVKSKESVKRYGWSKASRYRKK